MKVTTAVRARGRRFLRKGSIMTSSSQLSRCYLPARFWGDWGESRRSMEGLWEFVCAVCTFLKELLQISRAKNIDQNLPTYPLLLGHNF